MKYGERLKELNKDYKRKSVLESIDRPIRKLVYHMNRIGLKTRFSCCGFHYENEEEPKTHDRVSYVQFSIPTKKVLGIFKRFTKDAFACGWSVSYFGGDLWIIRKTNPIPNEYYCDDGISNAIHDYENQVISITSLEKTLSRYPSNNGRIKIIDGNKEAKRRMPEWQVKPKLDYKEKLK